MKRKDYGLMINWCNISIALVFFVIITLLVMYVPQTKSIDSSILYAVHGGLSVYPISIAYFLSDFTTAHWFLWPLITASCVMISHRKYVQPILFVIFVEAALKLVVLMKNFVGRVRPTNYLYHDYSFPSGHALGTMCFFGILIFLTQRYVKSASWRNCLVGIFGLWIILVCISRMWLLVHYPTDILAGLLAGFILVNLYAIIIKWLDI